MSAAFVQRELDDLLLRLKGLVLVRARLERRGAPPGELASHDAEIARVRAELAQLVQESRGGTAFDASVMSVGLGIGRGKVLEGLGATR